MYLVFFSLRSKLPKIAKNRKIAPEKNKPNNPPFFHITKENTLPLFVQLLKQWCIVSTPKCFASRWNQLVTHHGFVVQSNTTGEGCGWTTGNRFIGHAFYPRRSNGGAHHHDCWKGSGHATGCCIGALCNVCVDGIRTFASREKATLFAGGGVRRVYKK